MSTQSQEPIDQTLSESFKSQLPPAVITLIPIIEQAGFNLTLVGGCVRDFLLTGKVSKDLDFEIRHEFEYSQEEWAKRINNLGTKLAGQHGHNLEFLSFSILRITFPESDWDVELAPARLESFPEQESYGHSDVCVELVSNAPYKETFKRRDFTINAIGIEFDPNSDNLFWVDPFGGRQNLSEMKLVTANPHFTKDPVRFCRAIRFALKFGLSFSRELEEEFRKFNLLELSSFYFFREASKVGYTPFFRQFFDLCTKYQIPLADSLNELSFLALHSHSDSDSGKPVSSKELLVGSLVFQSNATFEELSILTKAMSVKSSTTQNLVTIRDSLAFLESFTENSLKELSEKPLSDFLVAEELIELKKLHQLIYKAELLSLLEMFSPKEARGQLHSWLPQELQGKEDFLKYLKENSDLASKDRGSIQYYCHFQALFGSKL